MWLSLEEYAASARSFLKGGAGLVLREDNAAAVGYYEDALEAAALSENEELIAAIHDELGDLYVRLEQYADAIGEYEAVLNISDQENSPRLYAELVQTLADLHMQADEPAAAAERYEEVAALWTEIDDPELAQLAIADAGAAYALRMMSNARWRFLKSR